MTSIQTLSDIIPEIKTSPTCHKIYEEVTEKSKPGPCPCYGPRQPPPPCYVKPMPTKYDTGAKVGPCTYCVPEQKIPKMVVCGPSDHIPKIIVCDEKQDQPRVCSTCDKPMRRVGGDDWICSAHTKGQKTSPKTLVQQMKQMREEINLLNKENEIISRQLAKIGSKKPAPPCCCQGKKTGGLPSQPPLSFPQFKLPPICAKQSPRNPDATFHTPMSNQTRNLPRSPQAMSCGKEASQFPIFQKDPSPTGRANWQCPKPDPPLNMFQATPDYSNELQKPEKSKYNLPKSDTGYPYNTSTKYDTGNSPTFNFTNYGSPTSSAPDYMSNRSGKPDVGKCICAVPGSNSSCPVCYPDVKLPGMEAMDSPAFAQYDIPNCACTKRDPFSAPCTTKIGADPKRKCFCPSRSSSDTPTSYDKPTSYGRSGSPSSRPMYPDNTYSSPMGTPTSQQHKCICTMLPRTSSSTIEKLEGQLLDMEADLKNMQNELTEVQKLHRDLENERAKMGYGRQ